MSQWILENLRKLRRKRPLFYGEIAIIAFLLLAGMFAIRRWNITRIQFSISALTATRTRLSDYLNRGSECTSPHMKMEKNTKQNGLQATTLKSVLRLYLYLLIGMIAITYAITVFGRANLREVPDSIYIPHPDDAAAYATLLMGLVTGCSFFIGQKKVIEDKHKENLKQYTKRYTDCIQNLYVNEEYQQLINKPYPADFKPSKELRKEAFSAIGLFSEEFELLNCGSIDPEIWSRWKAGIDRIFSQNPEFWLIILNEINFFYDYKFLKQLANDILDQQIIIKKISEVATSLKNNIQSHELLAPILIRDLENNKTLEGSVDENIEDLDRLSTNAARYCSDSNKLTRELQKYEHFFGKNMPIDSSTLAKMLDSLKKFADSNR